MSSVALVGGNLSGGEIRDQVSGGGGGSFSFSDFIENIIMFVHRFQLCEILTSQSQHTVDFWLP